MSFSLLSSEQRSHGVADNLAQLIGNTPMVWLSNRINKTKAKIALKLESENPTKSVKDRLAIAILEEAEKAGKIVPRKSVIIEVSSGNTGISLAFACAIKGYRLVIVMPEQMSLERRTLILNYGAELVLTPASLNMAGAKQHAQKLLREMPNAFDAAQFETPNNAKIHYETTGREIWNQINGDAIGGENLIFITGVGTGGTLIGVSKYLKEKSSKIKAYGVEPEESAVLSGNQPGSHKIQGIGAGFVSKVVLDQIAVIDGIVRVKSDDAIEMARRLPTSDGIFCGISSGANVKAALDVASLPENEGKIVITCIPSFGERYLSTTLMNNVKDQAMRLPVVPIESFGTDEIDSIVGEPGTISQYARSDSDADAEIDIEDEEVINSGMIDRSS